MTRAVARFRLGACGLFLAAALLAAAPGAAAESHAQSACGPVLPGFAHCDAQTIKRPKLTARAAVRSSALSPADIQSAYGLTPTAADYGGDEVVAIVDAYDLPTAEQDLATYRSSYGLPPCTTANGCFLKVNQSGKTGPYPAYDAGWATEIALDMEAVSATCPHCRILLVEANSTSFSNLTAAVNRAATMGATQISNSWGNSEWPGELAYEPSFNHPGVAVTVSSGDDGYGAEYPASSRYVTAVGGTSLTSDGSARGWSETAWDGAGSGCSQYVARPSWQTGACLTRSVADVSAVADPNTGLAIYDSQDGWIQVGGTSLASPLVAAAYALTGVDAADAGFAYSNTDWFNDVTSGSNDLGNGSCTFHYLCYSGIGFDGPTGVGTPASAHPPGPPPLDSPLIDPGAGDGDGTGGGDGSTPAPAPVTPSAPKSSISVSSSAVAASRSGVIPVRLTCGSGPACRGVLTVQAPLKRGAVRSVGRKSFYVGSGRRGTVRLRLSSYGRSLLKRKRRIRLYGTALNSDGTAAQSSFTVRAPKKKRTKHRKH